jgi:hypothetical protein
MYEYVADSYKQVDAGTLKDVGKQAECHILWQKAFFRATGDRPPRNSFLQAAIESLGGGDPKAKEASAAQTVEVDTEGNAEMSSTTSTSKGKSKRKSKKGK